MRLRILKTAARRIVWGKFLNAGQTCVAPDYVLVQHSVKKKLIHYIEKADPEDVWICSA